MNFMQKYSIKGNFIGTCNHKGTVYILTTEYLLRLIPYNETLEILTSDVPTDAKAIISYNGEILVFTPNGIFVAYGD